MISVTQILALAESEVKWHPDYFRNRPTRVMVFLTIFSTNLFKVVTSANDVRNILVLTTDRKTLMCIKSGVCWNRFMDNTHCIKLPHLCEPWSHNFHNSLSSLLSQELDGQVSGLNELITDLFNGRMADNPRMNVSLTKHCFVWLPRKCDYWDRQTHRHRTKWSICAAMIHRWHNYSFTFDSDIFFY